MTSMCGKDNQIRLLLLNLTHARPHRVSLHAHLGDTYRQLLENLRGKAALLEHLPTCESFSNGRNWDQFSHLPRRACMMTNWVSLISAMARAWANANSLALEKSVG